MKCCAFLESLLIATKSSEDHQGLLENKILPMEPHTLYFSSADPLVIRVFRPH